MMLKIFLLVIMVLIINPYFAGANAMQNNEENLIELEDLRWKNRIILVFGQQDQDNSNLQQLLQQQNVEIEERDIRYFLFGKNILSNSFDTLTQKSVIELKSKYQSKENEIIVVLIGKDGDEKYRKSYFDLEEIYRVIDAMPMRKQEMAQQKTTEEKMLIDFNNLDKMENWWIINDGVMGGLSKSELLLSDEGTAIFRGTVSLENYGGFASTRTAPRSFNLKGYKGLLIRIKGDGKKYQIRLHDDSRFDGITYQYSFKTISGNWLVVRALFNDFIPVIRGRIVYNAPTVSAEKIQQIGFLIGDKQSGPFRIEIESIQAFK